MMFRILAFCLLLSGCSEVFSPTNFITKKIQMSQGFKHANQGMLSAALSHNGSLQFVGSIHHGGSLWTSADNERIFNWNHVRGEYSPIRAAVFSEDDKYVATSTGDTMVLWDAETGQPLRFFQSVIERQGKTGSNRNITTPEKILAIDLARQYVLLGQENHLAVVFDTVRGGIIGSLQHDGPVSSVSLDKTAKYAMTGSHDGFVRYWSLQNGEELYRWQHEKPIDLVMLSDSGKLAFTAAYKGHVSIWFISDGNEFIRLYDINQGITVAKFNDAETQILLGTSREKVILWDLERKEIIKVWTVPNDGPWHKAAILSVGFNDDGRYVAMASNGYTYTFN